MPITLPNLQLPASTLPQYNAVVQGAGPVSMQQTPSLASSQPAMPALAASPTQQQGPFGPKSSATGATKLWDATNLPGGGAQNTTPTDTSNTNAKPLSTTSTASGSPTPGQIAVANALAPYSSGSSGYGVGMMGQPDGGSAQWLANTNANRAANGALTTAQGVPYDPSTITATGPGAQARLQAHIDSLNAASGNTASAAQPAASAAAASPAPAAAAASPISAAPTHPGGAAYGSASTGNPWLDATNASRAKFGLPPLPGSSETASRGQSAATMGAPGAV